MKSQKKNDYNSLYCPICNENLSKTTIKSHFTHHWNNANSNINENSSEWILDNRRKGRKAAMEAMKKFSSKKDFLEDDNERLLSRIKNNRITRMNILREKTRRKNKKNSVDILIDEYSNSLNPSTCFMCGTILYGSLDQINLHIDRCLQQQQQLELESKELSNKELTKSKSFDEYTWAGQTRIRATSLHEGSLSDIANVVKKSKGEDDTEDELNIEDDGTEIYGQKQYNEQSIVQMRNETNKMINEDSKSSVTPKKKISIIRIPIPKRLLKNSKKDSLNTNIKESKELESKEPQKVIKEKKDDKSLIIDALREKIKEMEKQQKDSYKCLICLEPFVNPVTSINCWHVFCEKCWLQTLGAKRLCPQCQIITSPGDLRRIYL